MELEGTIASLRKELGGQERHAGEVSAHRQLLVEELTLTQEKLDRALEVGKTRTAELATSNKG